MRNNSSGSRTKGPTPQLVGAVVGALLGTVGRFVVAGSFLYYVSNWGGPFFRNQGKMSPTLLFGSGISAGLGLVVGGIAGYTCRPLLGALIGGSLSGLFCAGLFVLPANTLISMSGGGAIDYSEDKTAISLGFLAMIFVGMLAGGLGGAVGKIMRIKAESDRRS
jgi:hypothetical protein